MSITIATWNVNSVRSRIVHLLDWLKSDKPDIILLQELKCTDDAFPFMEIEELGYNIVTHGQKTYNGVAILSKFPIDDVTRGIPGNEEDINSRYIEGVLNVPGGAVRVASVYVPNGQTVPSQKFTYKLGFLDHLKNHIEKLLAYEEILVIGGDYNIAPEDSDVTNVKEWEGSVLTHDEARTKWRKIMNLGVYDACRVKTPTGQSENSWWDYRANGFGAGNGLRIDHLLLSPQAADKLNDYQVIKSLRALDKPSDHTPVVGNFL